MGFRIIYFLWFLFFKIFNASTESFPPSPHPTIDASSMTAISRCNPWQRGGMLYEGLRKGVPFCFADYPSPTLLFFLPMFHAASCLRSIRASYNRSLHCELPFPLTACFSVGVSSEAYFLGFDCCILVLDCSWQAASEQLQFFPERGGWWVDWVGRGRCKKLKLPGTSVPRAVLVY